jgi:hypothetical protein
MAITRPLNTGGILTLLCLAWMQPGGAAVPDPFPAGFSMGTLGAIVDLRGPTGRQPWLSAAFFDDSSSFGAALGVTSYFGAISGPDLYRASCGAWYSRNGLAVKGAFSHFNALGVYFEETGFLSIGSRHLNLVSLSAELTGTRMRSPGSPVSYSLAEAGVSAWIPWSWAGISARIEHLPLERSGVDGGETPPMVRAGIHTLHHRFGSQGALLSVAPGDPRPVCFTIGEEYRVAPWVAFSCAVANNPVLVAFGMTFTPGKAATAVALATHPKLGWSQGFAAEYRRR